MSITNLVPKVDQDQYTYENDAFARRVIQVAGSGQIKEGNYDTKIDASSSTLTYIGKADRGSSPTASVWQIKRVSAGTALTDITWADDVDTFTKIWDNRTSYSY